MCKTCLHECFLDLHVSSMHNGILALNHKLQNLRTSKSVTLQHLSKSSSLSRRAQQEFWDRCHFKQAAQQVNDSFHLHSDVNNSCEPLPDGMNTAFACLSIDLASCLGILASRELKSCCICRTAAFPLAIACVA